MARRRLEWLAEWGAARSYPRTRVRQEIAALQLELLNVFAALYGIVLRPITDEATTHV